MCVPSQQCTSVPASVQTARLGSSRGNKYPFLRTGPRLVLQQSHRGTRLLGYGGRARNLEVRELGGGQLGPRPLAPEVDCRVPPPLDPASLDPVRRAETPVGGGRALGPTKSPLQLFGCLLPCTVAVPSVPSVGTLCERQTTGWQAGGLLEDIWASCLQQLRLPGLGLRRLAGRGALIRSVSR